MGKIRISVALASYNGESYIKEQIDSILRNLTDDDEIVVSDDGSNDKTLEILKEYQEKGVNLQVLKGPGKGIRQNIANAIKHSKGKYIFLSDQDDVWVDGKVNRVMEYLGKGDCVLVNHDARVMDKELKEELMHSFFAYRGSKPGFFLNFIKNRYMGCCMAFDRRLISYVLPIPDKVQMHDQWIGLVCHMMGGKSLFLPEALILYRRHEKNVSDFEHGTFLEMLKKRMALFGELLRWRKRNCGAKLRKY